MPNGFYIGPLKIYFYGILIMLGALAAIWIGLVEARRRKLDPNNIWDMVPIVLILGIIGARLWHVFTPSESMGVGFNYYLTHPLEIFNTRQGGLGIPGAIIGGAIGLYIYTRRHKLKFLTWADILIPGVALAQAIGRWGNFFNQELYGPPSTLPWAIYIDPAHRLPGYEQYSTFQPLFLYESLWDLLNFFLLMFLGRRFVDRLRPGDIFWVYLIIYPVGRFFLEFIRLDRSYVAGVDANQVAMAIVALFGVAMLVYSRMRAKREGSEPPAESE